MNTDFFQVKTLDYSELTKQFVPQATKMISVLCAFRLDGIEKKVTAR